jgi:outer membrane biosynthesis protein TonB
VFRAAVPVDGLPAAWRAVYDHKILRAGVDDGRDGSTAEFTQNAKSRPSVNWRAKPLAPVRVVASLLVLAAAVLPAREVVGPQAAPVTDPCGPDFRGQLATILKLRDPDQPPVLGGSPEEELRLSLALVINDYLMVAAKPQKQSELPRSLRGLEPKLVRQWRDAGKIVPAVCEIVGFMHAHYNGVPYTPIYAELPVPEPVPAVPPARTAKLGPASAVAKPPEPKPTTRPTPPPAPEVPPERAAAPTPPPERAAAEPEPAAEPAPAPAPAPGVPVAVVTPKATVLPDPAIGAMAVRTAAQLEQLLSVPPYPTLRDLRVQDIELTRKELGVRRRTALRARAEILALLQQLRASQAQWAAVRSRFGPGGIERVEQGIERSFAGSSAAEERDEALRLWRGEP